MTRRPPDNILAFPGQYDPPASVEYTAHGARAFRDSALAWHVNHGEGLAAQIQAALYELQELEALFHDNNTRIADLGGHPVVLDMGAIFPNENA